MGEDRKEIYLSDLIEEVPEKFIYLLTGNKAVRLLDNSLPDFKEKETDLVVELEDGSIVQLEIETRNKEDMPLVMLGFYVQLKNRYPDKSIYQVVLYVGEGAPLMEDFINKENLRFKYELRDIRELSCKKLTGSSRPGDKLLSLLCDGREGLKELTKTLFNLPEKDRADYIRKLLIKRLTTGRGRSLKLIKDMMREL